MEDSVVREPLTSTDALQSLTSSPKVFIDVILKFDHVLESIFSDPLLGLSQTV